MTEYIPYQILTAAELNASIDGLGVAVAGVAVSVGVEVARAISAEAALASSVAGLVIPATPASWVSVVPRPFASKIYDVMSAADFGVYGNGTSDDTNALQAAIVAAETNAKPLALVGMLGASFKITRPLVITGPLRLVGSGTSQSALNASGNFACLLHITNSAAQIWVEHVWLNTTGTTTRNVNIDLNAVAIKFLEVSFSGDLNGILAYTQAAGFVEFVDCVWFAGSTGTCCVVFDGYNQNCQITGGHAGGPGTFLVVENTGGNVANNVQGLRICDLGTICTGPVSITLAGACFAIFINNCVIDQSGSVCVLVEAGAQLTQIVGGYFGVNDALAGKAIQIAATAGVGTTIDNIQTYGGAQSISVEATSTQRVTQVAIRNNTFLSETNCALNLDSVNGCIISGNMDLGSPALGSWATSATNAAGGLYNFSDNFWTPTTPANVHPTSSYQGSADRGVTFAKKGIAVGGAGATSVVVTHGLVLTPSNIQVSSIGANGGFYLSAITSTTFTINWVTPGALTWMWSAAVFD